MTENNANEFATVIGSDVLIKGEISSEKGIRIDGQVEGAVSTKTQLLIGKTGHLKADVRAASIQIEGKLTGNTTAEDVTVEASAQVYGDLAATKLTIAEGATFVGKLNIGPEVVKDNMSKLSDVVPASVASRLNTLQTSYGSTARH
jgi:cytoskeletal protein CcmA (bactofilin family)